MMKVMTMMTMTEMTRLILNLKTTLARTRMIAREYVEELQGRRGNPRSAEVMSGTWKNGQTSVASAEESAASTFRSSWSKRLSTLPACSIAMEFTLSRVPTTGSSRTLGAKTGARMASFELKSLMTR